MEYAFTFSVGEILILAIFIGCIYASGWYGGSLSALDKFDFTRKQLGDKIEFYKERSRMLVEVEITSVGNKVHAHEKISGKFVGSHDSLDELHQMMIEMTRAGSNVIYWYIKPSWAKSKTLGTSDE